MTVAFQTSVANVTIPASAGVHTGHVLVGHTGCTLEGATDDADDTIIRPDGQFAECVRPVASVATFTLRNLTIDMQALAALTVGIEVGGGIATVICENVKIIDHKRGAMAVYNRGAFRGTDVSIIGNGIGILHFTGATEATLRNVAFEGGQYGFQNTAAAGIDIDGFTWVGDYWQIPTYEAVTATAYGDLYVDVSSHVSADRTLYDIIRYLAPVKTFYAQETLFGSQVRQHDRIEVNGVAWTRVLAQNSDGSWELDTWRAWGKWKHTAPPAAIATVYRPTLGMFFEANGNRIQIQTDGGTPSGARWRHPNGETASTPSVVTGSRLDIIRVGGANSDADSGPIHITETAVNASVKNAVVRGSRADSITLRGTGTVAYQCSTELGYDMGFTIDGTDGRVTVTRCHAETTGRSGFHVTGGPCDLYACSAVDNGTLNDGSGDYGCSIQVSAPGCHVEMVGDGNLDGLVAGILSAPTHVATEATGAPPHPFTMVSPFWEAS